KDKAILALSDGTVEHGFAIGSKGTTGGELCFNTSMIGYQEIFTDPGNYGRLLVMTYPHIGNAGTVSRDNEARQAMLSGLIVRSFSDGYSNPQADGSLQEYLEEQEVVGISGIDTRKLVRHIRSHGEMNAVISSKISDEEKLVQKAKDWDSMAGLELATQVTRQEPQTIHSDGPFKVAAFDHGIKQSMVDNLVERGCTLRVFPAKGDYLDELKRWKVVGFVLRDGPGDPKATAEYALENIDDAKQTSKPIFGIGMGHLLISFSEGMPSSKMRVGHHGANQPVKNLDTGLVEITSQNNSFSLDEVDLDEDKAEITHQNLNDGMIEGLRYKNFPGISVQYHPEASPGPRDSYYVFDRFLEMLTEGKEQIA